MNPMLQKKIYCNKIVREFYKLTNGQTNYRQDLRQIAAGLKITGDNFISAYNDLKAEGLIEPFGQGYHSRLTQEGVKYVDELEFLEEKDIVILTIRYLKNMSGYRNIYEIFDGVGVKEDEQFRKNTLDFMYQHNLIEPSNYSEVAATVSQTGKNLTSATFDNLLTPKITHIMDYNSKRQIMIEAYKDGKVYLEIELQPLLKKYLNDADIREFIKEFLELGYITPESKVLSNGGILMGHHITNKGQAFLETGGFLKQADSKVVAAITNNSIVNHGPNYGNQSAGSFEGVQKTQNTEVKEKNKSLVSKFWNLISKNPLVSSALLALLSFVAKLIYDKLK